MITLLRPLRSTLLLCLLVLLPALPALADNGLAIDPKACLECHGNVVTAENFAASVHGQNACTSCHVEVTDLQKHKDGEVMPGPVKCARCHKKETAEHNASVHMLNEINCAACHSDLHSHKPWQGNKARVLEKCTECHDAMASYADSIHGQAVIGGNPDSAACNDCHNLYMIKTF